MGVSPLVDQTMVSPLKVCCLGCCFSCVGFDVLMASRAVGHGTLPQHTLDHTCFLHWCKYHESACDLFQPLILLYIPMLCHLSISSLEWMPKLRASYFVDVRSPREGEATTTPVRSMVSDTSQIGSMAADTRPFEEIKRMRLSQALDSMPLDRDVGALAIAPSPTFATCSRSHFDPARTTPRFSPGKGIKVSGFSASATSGRSAFGGGGPRDMGFGRQPLSPALTAPPTPPPARADWKAPENDPYSFCQTRVAEADQGVLPMEQRPLDEVNAVQALMSVGRGARAQTTPMSVPEEEIDMTSVGTGSQSSMQANEVCMWKSFCGTARYYRIPWLSWLAYIGFDCKLGQLKSGSKLLTPKFS